MIGRFGLRCWLFSLAWLALMGQSVELSEPASNTASERASTFTLAPKSRTLLFGGAPELTAVSMMGVHAGPNYSGGRSNSIASW